MIRLQKYGWLPLVSMIINVLILLLFSNGSLTEAFVVSIRQHRSHSDTRNVNVYGDEWQLNAKKNRKKANSNDDLFDWYQKIDNAQETNPDDIFWEEMERQKLWSNSNGDNSPKEASTNLVEDVMTNNHNSNSNSISSTYPTTDGSKQGVASSSSGPQNADSILSQFNNNMLTGNWIGENAMFYSNEGQADNSMMGGDGVSLLDEQQAQIDAAWDSLYGDGDDVDVGGSVLEDEPVDDSAFILSDDDNEAEQEQMDEEEMLNRMSLITIRSGSFQSLKANQKAIEALKSRKPDYTEGMEELWIGAIDSPSAHNLKGSLRLYGVELADNFGDWEYGSLDDQFQTIEDLASYKAREIYKLTGLPCISSQSMWDVEPAKSSQPGPGQAKAAFSGFMTPRTTSGYRFNDIDDRIDIVTEALIPVSDPARKTRFRSCVCYYDGKMETYTYGEVEVDILFCKSLKCFISLSSAITDMVNILKTTFGFEYQKWLKKKSKEAFIGYRGAGIKLRDRVLKEGRVLPNDIIDVSAFMDSMVDVDLMEECGVELAQHYLDVKATKILTVATTGLIIAMPIAKELQTPVVYARKERSIVMADTFQTTYSSNTVGSNKTLYVAKSHIQPEDRILIVDDFLAGGSTQEAMLRIISDAGATPVGIAVLIEKVYDSGRKSLSGFDVPVHSLVRVASVQDQIITLVEEEGYKEDEILD